MMTNPKDNTSTEEALNPQQANDERFKDFRDVTNIRVFRRNGFFGITLPVMYVLPGTTPQTSANYLAPFFRANRTYQVVEASMRFTAAESNVGTVDILKIANGVAPGSGTSILTAPISVAGTINTDTPGTISTVPGVAVIPAGTCLCLKPKTTPSMLDITGLTVYVLLKAI